MVELMIAVADRANLGKEREAFFLEKASLREQVSQLKEEVKEVNSLKSKLRDAEKKLILQGGEKMDDSVTIQLQELKATVDHQKHSIKRQRHKEKTLNGKITGLEVGPPQGFLFRLLVLETRGLQRLRAYQGEDRVGGDRHFFGEQEQEVPG
jgi:hypothetical protein